MDNGFVNIDSISNSDSDDEDINYNDLKDEDVLNNSIDKNLNNKYIECEEQINYHLLHKLITDSKLNDDDIKELNQYMSNYNINNIPPIVKVQYLQKQFKNKGIGRHFTPSSLKSSSNDNVNSHKFLTTLSRNLRNLLIKDIYDDLDMVNSAPSILLNICKKHNIQCPFLEDYINNRDKYVELFQTKYNLSESEIKDRFIYLTFGSSNTLGIKKLETYKKEISHISNILKDLDEYKNYLDYAIYNANLKNKKNISGIFVSILVQDYENKILMIIKHYLEQHNFKIGTLEYDGLKILKSKSFNAEHITNIEQRISEKLSFNIKLKIKELNIDDEYINIFNELNDYYIVSNDKQARNIMLSLFHDKIRFTQPKLAYININNIWECKDRDAILSDLKYYINETNIYKKIKDGLASYSHNSAGCNSIASLWLNSLSYLSTKNKNFEEVLYHSTIGKICFQDGVYDFTKRTFTPWNFVSDVYSTVMIPLNFNDVMNSSDKDVFDVKNKLIDSCLEVNTQEYFLHRLSRAIAGFITDKRWCVWLGFRNSGKGVLQEMLINSFGKYIQDMNSSNLFIKSTSGDSAKAQSWIVPLKGARIVLSNEIASSEKHIVDGNMIKKLASGGDPITARQNNKDEQTFKTQLTYMLLCNDIPKVTPKDAFQNCELYSFPWEFKNKNDIEQNNNLKCNCNQQNKQCNCNMYDYKCNYKLADDSIKTGFCRNLTYIKAFIKLIIDSFVDEMPFNTTINDNSKDLLNEDSNEGAEFIKDYFRININNDKFKTKHSELVEEIKKMKLNLGVQLKLTQAKIIKILISHGVERVITENFNGYKYLRLESKSRGIEKDNFDSDSDSYSDSDVETYENS